VRDNLQILFQIYYQPARAFSGALDRGNLVFAAAAAGLVSLPLSAAPAIIPLAVLLVPASIAIIAAWDVLGSTSVALRRDYAPLLICTLLSAAAAFLPVALASLLARPLLAGPLPPVVLATAGGAALVYFLILAVLAVRAVSGASVTHAAGAVGGGVAATVLGFFAYQTIGHFLYFLASPLVLCWIFMVWRPNFSSLTGGLRSRQNFLRHLEASTLNPRDADAHYQLGLIYQQRHNYTEAMARFQKAVEIDVSEPGPHYQLGRIAREQSRHSDALRHLEACVALDDKHESSEVWRDLGATNYELGHTELALAQLEKYVQRREYDPEGQYWLGQVYKRLGRASEAREALDRAIEAAQAAPPHRRRYTARWLKLSRAELRR
jgi:tetratricopeptide (TPR) repeat protein